jgi:hypothetical protein
MGQGPGTQILLRNDHRPEVGLAQGSAGFNSKFFHVQSTTPGLVYFIHWPRKSKKLGWAL